MSLSERMQMLLESIERLPDVDSMSDQSSWPSWLRDDAPFQRCDRCGRTTRAVELFDAEDRVPQPDGNPCGGRFVGDERTRIDFLDEQDRQP